MRALVLAALVAACGPSRSKPNEAQPDALIECTQEGEHRCTGATYQTCTGGLWTTTLECAAACVDTLGCVVCTPGQPFCKDGDVWSCTDDGSPNAQVQDCTGINVCSNGSCVDACADAAANKSYIGCEYWAVDLDNAVEVWGGSAGVCPTGQQSVTLNVCYTQIMGGIYAGQCDPQNDGMAPHTCPAGETCQPKLVCVNDAQHGPFAVVISNPQSSDANVTVTAANGATTTKVVGAGQVVPILMQPTFPDQSVDGSGTSRKGYHIVSDLPIVAYQFNPLDNSNVFSNDASLLIPQATFDTDYYVMAMPTIDRRPGKDPYYGYLTVVAYQDGTQVAVTPTVATVPSATQATIAAGTTTTFTLDAFDVLQLQAAGTGDLTGTHITSPNMKSFGVFGGNEAKQIGYMPSPSAQYANGPGFADHLEEMMFPSSTWGKTFAIARSKQRLNEPDVLRIMAQNVGTTVTITPAPYSGTCATLGPGQFCEVQIAGDTEITSNEPILVGHFLTSVSWFNNANAVIANATGDPSMALATPTEQYRKDYTILVPDKYVENYVSIAANATGGILVDGTAQTLAPFGTHRAVRVSLTAGQHRITCADGCGITVYGYSPGVSYMFAGGLDLKPIVIL